MGQFLGYRTKTTNIRKVENILRIAKANLREAAETEYHRMLSQEICELVDDITLGIVQRPNFPLLEAATNLLNEKIGRAEMASSGTEYDLRTSVSIIPDRQYTYFILVVSNPALEEAFRKSPDIEDYRVTEEELRNDVRTAAAAQWDELRKRCDNAPSLLSATLTNRMTVNPERLEFESPIVRAMTRARRNLTSRILNQYACGKEIQSTQLMPMLDKALAKLMDEDIQAELDESAAHLAGNLVSITMELVMHDPRKPAEQTFDAIERRTETKTADEVEREAGASPVIEDNGADKRDTDAEDSINA